MPNDPRSDFDALSEQVAAAAASGNGEAFQIAMADFIMSLIAERVPPDEALEWADRLAKILGMPFKKPHIQ